jgi:hypothetical protein
MSDRLASLEAIEATCWRELAAAVVQRDHPWRTPVLATFDGERADARTVVLRDFDDVRRELVIYTDARAAKVEQLRRFPHGTLVGWWAELGWQLRLAVRLEIETEGLATASRWARLMHSPAAQDYLSSLAPGAPLPDGSRPPALHAPLGQFGVITATVTALDWLELHREGHRRAIFDAMGGRWLQP